MLNSLREEGGALSLFRSIPLSQYMKFKDYRNLSSQYQNGRTKRTESVGKIKKGFHYLSRKTATLENKLELKIVDLLRAVAKIVL